MGSSRQALGASARETWTKLPQDLLLQRSGESGEPGFMPGPARGDREERQGRGGGFSGGSVIKNPPANAEDADSTPAPGRPPHSLA